jgi:hypothetical protein
MMAAVSLVGVAGWGCNFIAGIRVPLWRKPGSRPRSGVGEIITRASRTRWAPVGSLNGNRG